MVNIGKYNTLRVNKQQEHGFYLEGDDDWGDILLPNKYVPDELEIGDNIEVFVYLDSEDIIVATTQIPYATVGEYASLKVVSETSVGVFLDWGLEKDLLVPFREQVYEMHVGRRYVVYIYLDKSGRIAASTRLTKFIDTSPAPFKKGQKVDLLLCQRTDMGIKAIINGTHYGLIYNDDIINNLRIGQKTEGFILKLKEDNKIDLSLRPIGGEGRDTLIEKIVERLKASDGYLNVTAKTPAETINSMFNVSRKQFKVALGHLYKNKIIAIEDSGIRLL